LDTDATKDLEDLFRYELLRMLKSESQIIDTVIGNMLSWHHSGFNVYFGPTAFFGAKAVDTQSHL